MSCSILKTKLPHDFSLTSTVSNYKRIISIAIPKKQTQTMKLSNGSDNQMHTTTTVIAIPGFLFVFPCLLQTSEIMTKSIRLLP